MQWHYISLDKAAIASDHGCMECIRINSNDKVAVYIPFTPEESARFRTFLTATGRKAGPWVKTIVLAALDREEGKVGWIEPRATACEVMEEFVQLWGAEAAAAIVARIAARDKAVEEGGKA